MTLVYNERSSTQDIDDIFRPSKEIIRIIKGESKLDDEVDKVVKKHMVH